nr:type II secretion system protein [uncultured Aquabacterium sp.]
MPQIRPERAPATPPRQTLGQTPGQSPQRGFTMAEMVVVLAIGGILSAFVFPKLSAMIGIRDDAWRDNLVSAMRLAQKTAVSHRRLVCVTVTNTTVAMRIATVNPSTTCNSAVPGPDGSANFAVAANSQATTTLSPAGTPAGTLYFQPDGRVTTDGAGASATDRTLTPTAAAAITIRGETGHVE